MNTTYTLNMSEQVKLHFDGLMAQECHVDEELVIADVENMLNEHHNKNHRQYIKQRIDTLGDMLNMLMDKQWHLSDEYKDRILKALQYFSESDDIIPDDIPVIGFLDDCIVIDLAAEKLIDELKQYQLFTKAVKIYDLDGVNDQVDQWETIKKQELLSRIRHRRRKRSAKGGTHKSRAKFF